MKSETATRDELRSYAHGMRRIRRVARRRRALGQPDRLLELGCAALEKRLEQMREQAQ